MTLRSSFPLTFRVLTASGIDGPGEEPAATTDDSGTPGISRRAAGAAVDPIELAGGPPPPCS
eukprot:8731754-Pyramimonas_sp.AAC.1